MAWEKELPKDSPFSFLLYPAHQELSGWQSSFPRNTNRGRSVQNRDTCIPVTLNKQVNQHLEAFGLSLNLLWVWLLSPVSGYTNNISGDPDPPNTGLALWVQAKWSQALQNKNNDWTISTTSVIGIIFGDPSHTLASLYNKRKFLWKQNIWILVVLALIHANVNKPFRIVSQNNLLCFKPVSMKLGTQRFFPQAQRKAHCYLSFIFSCIQVIYWVPTMCQAWCEQDRQRFLSLWSSHSSGGDRQ